MNVEKVIRVLGYIVYTALWSPVIVLALVVVPVVYAAMWVRAGLPIKECLTAIKGQLMNGIRHDMEFIETGKW